MPTAPAHDFLRTHSISGRTSSNIVKALIRSMAQNGWRGEPIVIVRRAGEMYILDGHHRAAAARRAKIEVAYREISIDGLPQFGYSSIEEVVNAYAEAGPNRLDLR